MTRPLAIHTSMPGPWGPFFVAATGSGVVAVDWLTTRAAFEERLTQRLGGPIQPIAEAEPDDPRRAHLVLALDALDALLAGRPHATAVPLDLSDRPTWDRHVLGAVAGIPFGSTASYGEIARRVGAPRAARAVGGAVGRNPIGLLIPCHRVIAADGTIGGYGGDAWGSRDDRLEIKRALLRREGVEIGQGPSPEESSREPGLNHGVRAVIIGVRYPTPCPSHVDWSMRGPHPDTVTKAPHPPGEQRDRSES